MSVISQSVKIQNLKGLHARATSAFVKVADSFESEISVKKQDLTVNGKSIMGLLMLGAPLGETIFITAEGSDAEEAIDALTQLVNNKFGEE
ncbi:MAG: HPr family phosphocarrier protein [Alphaproteobacteria bacterium]|nr:HPr family phosphocarrier protein [Alphaproteobacteria bacterium]